ncbi:MAG: hypothetical protein WB677_15380 [Xanthobacteraceae bacterium]
MKPAPAEIIGIAGLVGCGKSENPTWCRAGADINEPAVLSHFFREQQADDLAGKHAAGNGPGMDHAAMSAHN